MIIFNGKLSSDYYFVVEHYPIYVKPKKKTSKISIPGKNGDLIIDDGEYENSSLPYEIVLDGHIIGFEEASEKLSQFVYSDGYARLEDSYFTQFYRMAVISDEIKITNYKHKMGRATLNFDALPERWYKSGEKVVSVKNEGTIVNPSVYKAKPLIKVYGTGPGTIAIGPSSMRVNTLDDFLNIDCETQNVYRNVAEFRNSYVERSDFIEIGPGESKVTFDGGISKVEIIPRWWTI